MGAWTQVYRKGETGAPGTPLAYAIVALKYELHFNGHGEGLTLNGPTFGVTMAQQTRAFQEAAGLSADGVIGQPTARALYRKRIASLSQKTSVPVDVICKVASLESAF